MCITNYVLQDKHGQTCNFCSCFRIGFPKSFRLTPNRKDKHWQMLGIVNHWGSNRTDILPRSSGWETTQSFFCGISPSPNFSILVPPEARVWTSLTWSAQTKHPVHQKHLPWPQTWPILSWGQDNMLQGWKARWEMDWRLCNVCALCVCVWVVVVWGGLPAQLHLQSMFHYI